LLTHGVFKALLFLGAGAVIHAVGSNDIGDMSGLAKKMPQTAIVFLVGTLSLAGVPLFAGFASKEEVLGAVWHGGFAVPFVMLLVAAFLTAFYMFRVVFVAFFGGARRDAGGARREARGARREARGARREERFDMEARLLYNGGNVPRGVRVRLLLLLSS
jgi:NADH:ubiquinone oxidoreductase subunit 5 (subunit L)/multisubunit Na+/H+ antiporter MnhA subunit